MASKITYKVRLDNLIDTSGLSPFQKQEINDRLGEYLQDKILEDVSRSMSPVSGKKWKSLSPKYKTIKSKTASSEANLELTGDMLDALTYEIYRDGFEIGVFDYDQAQKMDNHCKFSAASMKTALPKRQAIPQKDENFRSGIVSALKEYAEDLKNELET